MHFQETYTTALKRPEVSSLVEVSWVADLEDKQPLVLKRCAEAGQKPEFVGVQAFDSVTLPKKLEEKLNACLKKHPIDAVMVSTTPEQHRAYAAWALKHHIPVLLDKPVSTRKNAVYDTRQAMGILEDWEVLNRLSIQNKTMVMVNSHRRFHPAYYKVGQLLEDITKAYGFGITSISSFNSDGQWRLPNELAEIDYHGFDKGNGVLSHFGYHYLDLAATWYRKGTPAERRADSAAVSSSFSLADNYARQITAADAERVLKPAGQPVPPPADPKALAGYGEVDSFNSIEMMQGGVMTGHISLQMLHSGFSQRAWTKPAANLYKENGRLRWENHLIQQGPLHAIEVRSFQAVQPSHYDPEEGIARWELGGADQLEINIFRNRLIGGKPLETIEVASLIDEIPKNDVMHEHIKAQTMQLFVSLVAKATGKFDSLPTTKKWRDYVKQMINGTDHDLSLIGTHQPTAALMAAAYASHATRINKPTINERIKVDLQW